MTRSLSLLAAFCLSTAAFAGPANSDRLQTKVQDQVMEYLQDNASPEVRARFSSATPEQQAAFIASLKARALERVEPRLRERQAERSAP